MKDKILNRLWDKEMPKKVLSSDFVKRVIKPAMEEYANAMTKTALYDKSILSSKTKPPADVGEVSAALRICDIEIHPELLGKALALVDLIAIKGDAVTIKDVLELKAAWSLIEEIV